MLSTTLYPIPTPHSEWLTASPLSQSHGAPMIAAAAAAVCEVSLPCRAVRCGAVRCGAVRCGAVHDSLRLAFRVRRQSVSEWIGMGAHARAHALCRTVTEH